MPFFGALATLGEPQSAVQIWATWPLLTSVGQTAGSATEWVRLRIGHVTAYIVCKFQLHLRCVESGLNPGCDLKRVSESRIFWLSQVKQGHVSKSGLKEKLLRLMGYQMVCFDLEFCRSLCLRTAVQLYFRHNTQMTLGQRMTLGSQIASGKVRSDSCESFGAIFWRSSYIGWATKCCANLSYVTFADLCSSNS